MVSKGEVGGHALKSQGNYIIGHGKSWKNHGIMFLNFCGNPVVNSYFGKHKVAFHQRLHCLLR